MKRKDSPVSEINSPQNPKYRRWLSLLDSKGIKEEGLALLSGLKIVHEIAAQMPDAITDVLLPPKAQPLPGPFKQTYLSAALFKNLDVVGTKTPLAVVRTPKVPLWQPAPPQGLELIVALSDPGNLGSLLRSAEAFGVSRVILAQECASPFLPKALRASSGSNLRLQLASAGGPLHSIACDKAVGLDMHGQNIQQFDWPRDCYLILGEEGQGLPDTLSIDRLRIPMHPPVESLNATVAAALALFSYRIKWPAN